MPLVDSEPFLQESTPAVEYLKKTLDTEDVVVFTDRPVRSAFILAQDILEGFEKKFTSIILDKDDNKEEILKVLDKITNNAELPHLFYQKKYVGGSREIVLQYESGELEANLGVEPYMELPKMYPTAEDYELKAREDALEMSPDIEAITEEFIKEKVKNNKVVIFSKTYCGFSKLSKNIFHEEDHIYHAVELDKRMDGFIILKVLTKMTGNDHTPHVFVKGQYLGGGTDLQDLHDIDRIRYLLELPPKTMYEGIPARRPPGPKKDEYDVDLGPFEKFRHFFDEVLE